MNDWYRVSIDFGDGRCFEFEGWHALAIIVALLSVATALGALMMYVVMS
jgi:nitrogen fixation protein FixH